MLSLPYPFEIKYSTSTFIHAGLSRRICNSITSTLTLIK